jgi:acyl dehydratase
MSDDPTAIGGPYYEDLAVGDVFDSAPAVTLTAGHAALHQAIVGDRLRLSLDQQLSAAVLGVAGQFAHPALVCDMAIGQSTEVTGRVVANLFYRGLVLQRPVMIGDTLTTRTEVVGLRDNAPKPGRRPTGMAVLHMTTVDHEGRPVLDFHRCAMLPMRSEDARPGHSDSTDAFSAELDMTALSALASSFDLARYRERCPGADDLAAGARFAVENGTTVTGAPELVQLTLNLAGAHTDPRRGSHGRRLVYGGHTIGVAAGHLTKAVPDLVTIAGWRSCDHVGPVYEQDVLTSAITVEDTTQLASGSLVDFRVTVAAHRPDTVSTEPAPVLDWRLVGVMA